MLSEIHSSEPWNKVILSIDRSEVEEDKGLKNFFLRKIDPKDPVSEIVSPDVRRLTPLRINGHDPASTSGKSTTFKSGNDLLGKGKKISLDFLFVSWGDVAKENRVVLVGPQGLFATPLASEGEPGIGNRGTAMAFLDHGLFSEKDDFMSQMIVKGRDQFADVLRHPPVFENHSHGQVDVSSDGHDLIDIGRLLNPLDDRHRVIPLGNHEIVLRNDPDELHPVHDRKVFDPIHDHGEDRLEAEGIGRNGKDRFAHDVDHRWVGQFPRRHDLTSEVSIGHDPHGHTDIIHDDRGAHSPFCHSSCNPHDPSPRADR